MKLYTSGTTDAGCVRTNNEDYIYGGRLTTGDYLFVVADGMGGHHAGEVASRRAVTRLVDLVEGGVPEPIRDSLGAMFAQINSELFHDNQKAEPEQRMGTTLTALLARGNLAYVAHVGDSRLYRYRNGSAADGQPAPLTRITDDDSLVGALVRDGAISEAEARVHPRRSVLNQAIGMREHINPQIRGPVEIQPGDKYLLCSDGLSSVVSDADIREFLDLSSTEHITKRLVSRARSAGGPDNISVIVVSTEPDAAPSSGGDTSPEIEPAACPGRQVQASRRALRWFLLGLLALLLAAVVYLLVGNAAGERERSARGTAQGPTAPKGNR